jgi:hypothetical protein
MIQSGINNFKKVVEEKLQAIKGEKAKSQRLRARS